MAFIEGSDKSLLVFSGAVFGSVGVAMIASAVSGIQGTDDFKSGLLMLTDTRVMAAVLGG